MSSWIRRIWPKPLDQEPASPPTGDNGGLLKTAPPQRPSEFLQSNIVGNYGIQEWNTPYGNVIVAHPIRGATTSPQGLLKAMQYARGGQPHEWLASAVVVQSTWLHGPEIFAVDLKSDGRCSERYLVSWPELSRFVGTEIPWWHSALRSSSAILEWSPGSPTALVPAEDYAIDLAALALLAAEVPSESPTAAVCLSVMQEVRRRETEYAQECIREVEECHADLCQGITIAARPLEISRSTLEPLSEAVLRAGWAEIAHRRDTLAYEVGYVSRGWDGGRYWPMGELVDLSPESCGIATQFVNRLHPTNDAAPPTVMERRVIEKAIRDGDNFSVLVDNWTKLPVIKRIKLDGQITYHAASPQRLPTTAPLSAVTFSNHVVWVHTSDGGLWLAPQISGDGLSWGYNGSGPRTLAILLDRLMNDIAAFAVYHDGGLPPAGLLKLTTRASQTETTTYTRRQLTHARSQDMSPLLVD